MKTTQLIDLFQKARASKDLALIEGVQALKHTIRFEADVVHVVTCDISQLENLIASLAPDISSVISKQIIEVDNETFSILSPKNHRTKVASLAYRKNYNLSDIDPEKPIVFLENPKDLENIGAVIRVAAAANAAAVATDADVDVWHPAVIRGGAGLHYALPVINSTLSKLQSSQQDRQLISLDPTGDEISIANIPKKSIFIFGTERGGITKETLHKSDRVVRLKMRSGVSSLNLATSVAATLYQIQPVIT